MTLEQAYLKAVDLEGKISQDIFRDLMDTEIVAVVHAHWVDEISNGYDAFSCSNCHLGKKFHVPPSSAYLFCPWCGAKMDDED